MPRPKNNRIVYEPPSYTEFKPAGVSIKSLEEIQLNLDEFEAIRLADLLGMSHEEAANEMGISRSTFSRLIVKSRKKIADFFFQGKLLTVAGGNIHFRKNIIKCSDCGHMFKIDIGTIMTTCPECSSKNLLSLAGNFGHGECCRIAYIEYKNKEK
ncbi:MAG: DNA-binding protein [Bacteroidetes bacterium]|nr:MAG: DNA-binding protein [Bacteroidota bacterium]